MASNKFNELNFRGDKEIAAAMARVAWNIRDNVIANALRSAGRRVVVAAKALCPVDLDSDPAGTLRQSIGMLLRGRRGKKYLAIGARTGFARIVSRPIVIAAIVVGRVARKADPSRYAHLVELGHRVVKAAGAVAGFVAARPFLRPAMAGQRAAVKAEFIRALSRGQEAAAKRYAAKAAKLSASTMQTAELTDKLAS